MVLLFSCLALLAGVAVTANAQKYEIHPYAGAFFPGKFAGVLEISNGAIYGMKGGVYLTRSIEAEGQVAYFDNVAFDGTSTRKKAYLWEALASYNFALFRIRPKFYGTFGVGGLTTGISADSVEFWGPSIPTRDSFLSLTYGGGVKALRQWGPLGYRTEVRAHTLPNYYGFRLTWPELTAGITLSWGRSEQDTTR
jgi:hypothetical protein